MTTTSVEQEFQMGISTEIRLEPDGFERYQVATPFTFDDGDCFVIVLKCVSGCWVFSDEGHTMMRAHFDCGIDMDEYEPGVDRRQDAIANVLRRHQLDIKHGDLTVSVRDGRYGEALFDLVQAIDQVYSAASL